MSVLWFLVFLGGMPIAYDRERRGRTVIGAFVSALMWPLGLGAWLARNAYLTEKERDQ